jgi:hypothetical protein
MPRRELLTPTERVQLFAFPEDEGELIRLAGDLHVVGSRQFQDFEDYLLPTTVFRAMRSADRLSLDVPATADEYLSDRLKLLREALEDTNRLAGADELPDARINDKGLKISPLEDDTPREAKLLESQTYDLLPHVKITDLLTRG